MATSPDQRLMNFTPLAEKCHDPNDYVLTANDMERISVVLPPWDIQSVIAVQGIYKVFSTTLPTRSNRMVRKLQVAFCDEQNDQLVEIFGGSQEEARMFGEMTGHSLKTTVCELNVSIAGGPLTLGDIDRVIAAENYLMDQGFVEVPRVEITGAETP
jgi:hypothetical protein